MAIEIRRLTHGEWRELVEDCAEIFEQWGLDIGPSDRDATDEEIETVASNVEKELGDQAAFFSNYTMSGPGYSGAVVVILGDELDLPEVLIREGERWQRAKNI